MELSCTLLAMCTPPLQRPLLYRIVFSFKAKINTLICCLHSIAMSLAASWLLTSLSQPCEDIALEAPWRQPALWAGMTALGNLTRWVSQWLVQSFAYPGYLQSPQASGRLWLRDKHTSETTRHHSALHPHKQEDCAVSRAVSRSHFSGFAREIKQTPNAKQKGRPFFLLQ